jgi:hypothetical protein
MMKVIMLMMVLIMMKTMMMKMMMIIIMMTKAMMMTAKNIRPRPWSHRHAKLLAQPVSVLIVTERVKVVATHQGQGHSKRAPHVVRHVTVGGGGVGAATLLLHAQGR